MTFGEKLAKLRKENNYTQEQLSEHLGVSRQAISKWESNSAYPETDKIIRLSELFNCSLDYFLKDGVSEIVGRGKDKDSGIFKVLLGLNSGWKEYRSETQVCGMPLIHIARNAHGFISIGLNAKGVISVGLLSRGVLSLGVLSLGILSLGTFALGLVAAGCISAGIIALGAICIGILSFGAMAIGEFSVGALAIGKYFAKGDVARAAVAIGKTRADGMLFQWLGELGAKEANAAKFALDSVVPGILGWAKAIVKGLIH